MTTLVSLVLHENNEFVTSADSQPMWYVESTDSIDTNNQPLPAGVTGSIPELTAKGYTDIQSTNRPRYYKDIFGGN
jgi:hypothetical protein